MFQPKILLSSLTELIFKNFLLKQISLELLGSSSPLQAQWTSGSFGGPKVDLSVKWQTSGGWGNMRQMLLDADGNPIESTCTRNHGAKCDPKVLGHAG